MQAELFPEIPEQEKEEREMKRQAVLDALPFFPAPRNDNEVLLNLQRRLLADNDRSAWGEMWERCMVIAGKLITIERMAKGLHFSDDELEDLKIDAVAYVLRRYRKTYSDGSVWHVKKSFMNALRGGVLHALYYEAQDKPKVKVLYAGDLFDVLSMKEDGL